MIERSSHCNVNWKKMGNLELVLTPKPKLEVSALEMCLPSNLEEKVPGILVDHRLMSSSPQSV